MKTCSKLNKLTFFIALISIQIQGYTQESKAVAPSQMVQGGVGLWQTPTARMMPEGSQTISYTDNNEYRFWSSSLQLFPWMEATVRYTDVRTQLYSNVASFSGNQTLKDKGIDVKFRLLEEDYYLPQVAMGFRDFGGTGFFESEFINFSKRLGPVDVHLGIGWGYLGAGGNVINPLCEVADSYCERPSGFSGSGGKIEFGHFFKGPASIFGGIEYQTPIDKLRVKLEYEGNNYLNDRAGELEQSSPWNLGLVYEWNDFDFSLNYQRGNTVGFGVTYKLNLHTAKQVKFDKPPRSIDGVTPAIDMKSLNRQRLYTDLYTDGSFLINYTHQTSDEMTIYGNQFAYRDNDEAIERVGRILASELPESIKTYRIVTNAALLPMVETEIDADAFKSAALYEALESDLTVSYQRQEPSTETLTNYKPNNTSGLFHSVNSFWIQTFGGPESFYLYQGGAILSGGYGFNENFSISGGVKATLIENFDKFNFTTDRQNSTLPRVRTQVREYVTRSKVTLETAFLHWTDRIAPNLFAQAYGGYLETMFGGVGTELFYSPVDSNLSFGIDLNYVQQRSYENNFDFFDYKTFTGHASMYWRPDFLPDTQIVISAGQFLAKDKGVNIDFAKRFDSGIIVGAYAAITNVSAEEYGEGSFTKGFYISIPFDLFVLKPAKGRGKIPWVPIGRDGGQMLQKPVNLIDLNQVRSPFYD
ncbi:MAG: YjbH domain-containing protein [Paraglaciecola sp.]|uniref:YjbH domain-containing protein n=1 Tax=Paraglaciecola sp. TaxID=1920173 RepID=UPI0032653553